jgi:twitching motility protein PilU
VNANQAMDRILNMFSSGMRDQLLMDLSANLKAVISQRLIPGMNGELACAVEILMTTPFITELIREGNFHKIKDVMEKGGSAGMLTFDQSLYNLYTSEKISIKQALTHADSSTNLEWRINFGGAEKPSAGLDEDDALVLPSEQV